ncbi:hypothetical protein ABEB36_015429 [Hypothenemus hampei]|uniref:Uncharacterized protein n=1 Tax=Hypothenemus hampei TaxID=57062 RepID=A0ABD1E069_HYPHA
MDLKSIIIGLNTEYSEMVFECAFLRHLTIREKKITSEFTHNGLSSASLRTLLEKLRLYHLTTQCLEEERQVTRFQLSLFSNSSCLFRFCLGLVEVCIMYFLWASMPDDM